MPRWLLVIVTVISSGGFTASADDDRPRALAVLAAKQAELDRLAQEVAELEQQLDRPTQITIRVQMLSVPHEQWEELNPTDDAPQEHQAVSREWLKRLEDLQRGKKAAELSNVSVLASNGQAARYLSGGEFPIPVPESEGKLSVQWREFGNIVTVLPVLKGDGRVDLQVSAEHSLRDTNTEIKINKIKVPGLIRTRLQSQMTTHIGETTLIARGSRDDGMIVLLVTPERMKPVQAK